MVKFSGETDDGHGRLIGIALSRVNCERLLEGQPITFNLEELGLMVVESPPDITAAPPLIGRVIIMAGETEDEIMREFREVARREGVKIGVPDDKPPPRG